MLCILLGMGYQGCVVILNCSVAGCILLGVGYQGGVVKVYSLTTRLHWTSQFTIAASLATELHRETGEWVWSSEVGVVILVFHCAGRITGLLMVAHADGCTVHVCYNSKPPSLPPLSCILHQWYILTYYRHSAIPVVSEGHHSLWLLPVSPRRRLHFTLPDSQPGGVWVVSGVT